MTLINLTYKTENFVSDYKCQQHDICPILWREFAMGHEVLLDGGLVFIASKYTTPLYLLLQ